MEKLKNLEIEERSLLEERTINELKKMLEQKQKYVYDLSKEEEQTTLPTDTPAGMYDATGTSNPVVTTRNLKKWRENILGNLLSDGCQNGMEMKLKYCLVHLVLNSEFREFGARSGQVHQVRGKTWEVLLLQDAKVGEKSQFWGQI